MSGSLQRLLVTLTVTGGLLTAVATAANAGMYINHTEPVGRAHWSLPADNLRTANPVGDPPRGKAFT